ncbi:MAG TPA: carbohydrate porin [Candidatus Aquilonibacter sp.]|nr:carbohydrate porin [Candidatus Aquilonibacter sp.]
MCLVGARVSLGQSSTAPSDSQSNSTNASSNAPSQPDVVSSDPVTLFPHSETSKWWVSGQGNIVFQWHPSFPAAYSGPNSLRNKAESATSKVYTLYLGYELTSTTEVFLDMESAGGHGVSDALGLAGATNLDVVRNPDLSQDPYVARLMIRQIIPLSSERVEADRDELDLATSLPAQRIELRAGKFSVVDFVDVNSWGSDSHLQFLNWTVDNNGAYDYAANTRGYTDGALVEYDDHWFAARFVEALMPKVANGIYLDADIARSRAANLEFEAHGSFIAHRAGAVRLLSYLNTADMGNYEQANRDYEQSDGEESVPNIVATRRQGRHKYGFGLNVEQAVNSSVGVFGRLGWSDGRNESFAYSEVDRTGEIGGFFKGSGWRRDNDRAGVVFVANGIVAAHQEYLALGGLGFLLGDGGLTYGPEKIEEAFYTTHMWRGLFASFDLQHINNPGYNKARGPVIVPGLRFHFDF